LKETVKKIMNEDTSAIADIKLSIMEKLNVEYKLKEIDEAKEDSMEYKECFGKMLKKYGVNSPEDLEPEEKKKFFKEVDDKWKAKDEK
jgi:hypothetical protein